MSSAEASSPQDINSRTVGGTLAFCDWMVAKGYGTVPQVDPWRVALRKVFGAVDGDGFESLDWSGLDVDDYISRFQKLAGASYKAESIVVYGRRLKKALEAHAHYLETGRPPAARPTVRRQKSADRDASAKADVVRIDENKANAEQSGMVTFPYPLDDGRMISITMPPRLAPKDVDRITAFIRTLQDDGPERKQLPSHTGGQRAA